MLSTDGKVGSQQVGEQGSGHSPWLPPGCQWAQIPGGSHLGFLPLATLCQQHSCGKRQGVGAR